MVYSSQAGLLVPHLQKFKKQLVVAVAAIFMASFLGMTLNASASATTPVVVTPTDLQGWTEYKDGADFDFVTDSTAPLGSGALKMSTPDGSQYLQLDREAIAPATLASELKISYATKWLDGPVVHAAPAYVIAIDKDGNTTDSSDVFWAWYEPVYNNPSNRDYTQWNTWDITSSSNFWYNGEVPAEAIGQYTSPLSAVISKYPSAKVVGFTLNMGTGNGGWSALVDKVVTTEATYDFEPATVVPTDKDQCKKGRWATFNSPSYNNQGDCVSYVVSHNQAGNKNRNR